MVFRKLFLLFNLFFLGTLFLFANEVDMEYPAWTDPCRCPQEVEAELEEKMRNEEELTMKVDTAAQFRGGMEAFYAYQNRLIQYPAKNAQDSAQYVVMCRFVVERDGSLSNINLMTNTDSEFENEARRFLETMPRWIPARAEGKNVRSWNVLRLYFGYPDPDEPERVDEILATEIEFEKP
jgi:hypothetical protein